MIRLHQALQENAEISELRQTYRNVFSSPEGQEVLYYMLVDLSFFDETVEEKSIHLKNYAIRLLEDIGIMHEINGFRLVQKMFELPLYKPDRKDPDSEKERL